MPSDSKAPLDGRYLWIAVAPALIFALSALLIYHFSEPFDATPAIGEFDMYKAGAARTGVLAATMLFVGACFASIGFFAYRLRLLDTPSRRWTLVAFVALVTGAVSIQGLIPGHTAIDFAGRSLACFASEQIGAPQASAKHAAGPAATPQQRAAPRAIPSVKTCRNARFSRMVFLALLQNIAVALAFAALVCGAISTLARRPAPAAAPDDEPVSAATARSGANREADRISGADAAAGVADDDPELRHWEEQSEALNAFLYLGAFLLATALLFINAYLRWPSFVLAPTPSHDSYLATLNSNYGFTFSVMLGAFYIPVALVLSRRVRTKKRDDPEASKLPGAFKGPLQALKIVFAISSTAIAGALPEILDKIV